MLPSDTSRAPVRDTSCAPVRDTSRPRCKGLRRPWASPSQSRPCRLLSRSETPSCFREAKHRAAKALIQDQLDFYKSQPLRSDWFAIFVDAYWAKLGTEKGKLVDLSLFVAVGIDLEGHKEVLGFWTLEGRENKASWVQVLQDLIARGVHRVLLKVRFA